MYAFLEDCPLGFENEGLMFEACLVEAEKANLALNMHNALQDINRRKANLKRDSLGLDFNALVSFYESDDSGDDSEKKQGLVKKAWSAIASLFKSIGNFFERMSGKKIPDGTYEASAELPTFLQKAADLASKVHNVINVRNIASLMGAAYSASQFLDWIDGVWLKATGKKTKRYQKKEIEQMIDSARAAEEKYSDLVARANEKDVEQGFAKEWDHDAAKAEAEKVHLNEKVNEVTSGTIWGIIRKGLTTVGNWIKKTVTGLFNKIFKKDSEDGEEDGNDKEEQSGSEGSDTDGGDNGNSSSGDNSDTNKSDSNKPAENSSTSGNDTADGSSDNNDNDSSDGSSDSSDSDSNDQDSGKKLSRREKRRMKKEEKKQNKAHHEDGDDLSGDDLFDAVMESLDEVLSAGTPDNPVYEEDETDTDDRYNAYRDAENDLDAGYTPGEFDENDNTFEGYDFSEVGDGDQYTEEKNLGGVDSYSEKYDGFDIAFGEYTEDGADCTDSDSSDGNVFEGYDLDGATDEQHAEDTASDYVGEDTEDPVDDTEFDEDSSWEKELDALCSELLED